MQSTKLPMAIVVWILANAPFAALAEEICLPNKDTSLFADEALTQEDRMVFQFDGIQLVPETKDPEKLFGLAYDVRMERVLETPSYVRATDWDCETYPDVQSDAGTSGAGMDARVYDLSADACAQEMSDTRFELSAQTFVFYEHGCDIVAEASDAVSTTYKLACYGEGDEWEAEATLTPTADNGMTLKIDGNAVDYVPCSNE
jgi:hypothetical protein